MNERYSAATYNIHTHMHTHSHKHTHHYTQTLPKIVWKNRKMVSDTPFSIVENKRLDCQFGHHYYKEKPQKSSRVRIQGCRKMGCLVHITIKKCTLYPDYSLQPHECRKSTIRALKEKKIAALKANLNKNAQNVTSKTIYYVSLPIYRRCTSGSPYRCWNSRFYTEGQ